MEFKAFSKDEMKRKFDTLEEKGRLDIIHEMPRTMPADPKYVEEIIEFLEESSVFLDEEYEYISLYNEICKIDARIKAYIRFNLQRRLAIENNFYPKNPYGKYVPYILWYANMEEDEKQALRGELEKIMFDEGEITKDVIENNFPLANLLKDIERYKVDIKND